MCPFHKEKTPSFHVNAERGFYYCFGCHESGDAIKFVQRIEGLEFSEAVRELAERAGIQIIETSLRARAQAAGGSPAAAAGAVRRRQRRRALLRVDAARTPTRRSRARGARPAGLSADSPTGPIADALQSFRIGYAPYGWDGLARHLVSAGLSVSAAEKIGVIVPRKTGGGYYDRFRHRLMFAVLDLQGRVVAFSGRSLADPEAVSSPKLGIESTAQASAEAPAKYVHSPESPIYKKREAVFGLYQARQSLRAGESCVVVEGNFDVMSLHARGISKWWLRSAPHSRKSRRA